MANMSGTSLPSTQETNHCYQKLLNKRGKFPSGTQGCPFQSQILHSLKIQAEKSGLIRLESARQFTLYTVNVFSRCYCLTDVGTA